MVIEAHAILVLSASKSDNVSSISMVKVAGRFN